MFLGRLPSEGPVCCLRWVYKTCNLGVNPCRLAAALTGYNIVLWGLDAPGYVAKKTNVTASLTADRLLKDPGYILFSSTMLVTTAPLDVQLADMIGTNLLGLVLISR